MYYFINLPKKIRQPLSFLSSENQYTRCSPSNGVQSNYIMSSCARDPAIIGTVDSQPLEMLIWSHHKCCSPHISMFKIILQAANYCQMGVPFRENGSLKSEGLVSFSFHPSRRASDGVCSHNQSAETNYLLHDTTYAACCNCLSKT